MAAFSWGWVALSAVFVPSSGASPPDPTELLVDERSPVALVVIAPTGEVAQIRTSAIIRMATEVIQGSTDLRLVNLEPEVVEDCRGRLLCLARKVRPDAPRSFSPNEGAEARGAEGTEERRESSARYVLVLLNVTQPSRPDRFGLSLVSTDKALELLAAAERSKPGWEAQVEAQIGDAALSVPRAEIADDQAARVYLEHAITQVFLPVFEREGFVGARGSLTLSPVAEGLEITLDGASVGLTRAGETRLTGLHAGRRRLGLHHDGYEDYETVVEVERGREVKVQVALVKRAAGLARFMGGALLWGGVAVSAAGAGILTYALATQDSSVQTLCFGCSGGKEWVGFRFDPARAETGGDVNPPSVPIAPLGYSLLLSGAVWSVSALVFGSDDLTPWIALLAGAALGTTSFVISVAAGG